MSDFNNADFTGGGQSSANLDEVFKQYFSNPESPQLGEIRRIFDDLLLRNNELESKVEHLRQMVQHLEAYRNRYVDLYELAPVGYATLDEDGYVQEINLAGLQLLGAEKDEIIGYPMEKYVRLQDREYFHERVRKSCCERHVITFEVGLVTKAGKSITAHVRGVPIEFIQSESTFCKIAITDISERKIAEEAIRASEANYRAIFDTANDAIFVHDPDTGAILDTNQKASEMFGFTIEELRQVNVGTLSDDVPSCSQAEAIQRMRLAKEGSFQRFDWRAKHKNGRLFWVEVNLKRTILNGSTRLLAIVRDITDRKTAENAIRESEDRFRTVADFTYDWETWRGPDLKYLYVSPSCHRITGYTHEEFMSDPQLLERIIHPEDRERMLSHFRLQKPDSAPLIAEFRIITKSGEERWIEHACQPVHGSDQRWLGQRSSNRDITDRKIAEVDLKQARDELEQKVKDRTAQLEIFRMFAEASGQGFGMADLDGYITYWNPTLCRLFGEDEPENVVGRHVTEFYPIKYFDKRQKEILPALIDGGHWQGELQITSRQGKTTTILQNTFLIRDEKGNPIRLAAAITDVTRRKQAEDELRQSHDQLQTICDGMVEGLLITDIETRRIRRVNPSMCRMLEYSESELLTKTIPELHPPEEATNDVARFQAAAEGRVSINEDRPVVRKNGSIFYADITGHPIVYERHPCLLALFRDVTERKHAEEKLERERHSLWHMLQASDHERQIISYEIHDGLAQHLAAATMQFEGYTALKDNAPEEAQKAYDTAVALVHQAHFEARRLISEVRPPVIDENGLAMAISHLINEQQRNGGPEVYYACNVSFTRLPSILENSLYRIVQEALTNACKHSKSEKIGVVLSQTNKNIKVVIRDWGIGFDPEAVEEERFGLEGIRQRVRLIGGRLTFKSKPGSGTVVQVVVPMVARHSVK